MPRSIFRRPYSGFTLIELLAVIAIIGMLSGLSIVAIGRARESARNAACISNWRDYGRALGLFVADNKGRLPYSAYSYTDENGQSRPVGASRQVWYQLAIYARSDAQEMLGQKQDLVRELMREQLGCPEENWDPGFNVFVSTLPLASITRPGSTVYGTDVRSREGTTSWQQWVDLNHLGADANKQLGEAETKPHRGRINMLYIDGHVSSRLPNEVMIADFTRDSTNYRTTHNTTALGQ